MKRCLLVIVFLSINACVSIQQPTFQPPSPDDPHATIWVETIENGLLRPDTPVVLIYDINSKPVNRLKEDWKFNAYGQFIIPIGDTFIETKSSGYIRFAALPGKTYIISRQETPDDFTLIVTLDDDSRNQVAQRTFKKPTYPDYAEHKLENAMVDAIAMGDPKKVRQLLQKGADPNWQDPHGLSPIPLAAQENDMNILRFLVETGGEIDNAEGSHALRLTAAHGNMEMVQYLVNQGVDINRRQRGWEFMNGNSALMEAAKKGHTEIVAYLLKHGAYTEFRNEDGKTAKDLAEEGGYIQIVRLLSNATLRW